MAINLKQFDKWCDEIEYFCVDYTKRDSMRRGWKAALKWAEQQVGDSYYKGYKAIKKELGDE